MAKLLDENGLAYFWGKVKAAISAKMDSTNPTGTGSFAMNMKSGATLGTNAHVEGENCTASGLCSHAEGSGTTASGYHSHSEGIDTIASETASHAEGDNTQASEYASHAEGYYTEANGMASHAEGDSAIASGTASHAEGDNTEASGTVSHAEGTNTIASAESQHTQGKYNIKDTEGKYAHIVGNGTADDARSNAHTLDWSGNAWYAGKVTVGAAPTEDLDVATKKYVDEKGSSVAVTGTLTSGSTSLTLSDSSITTSSMIDIYTDDYTIAPTNAVVTDGSITLTFDAQTKKVNVKVKVTN